MTSTAVRPTRQSRSVSTARRTNSNPAARTPRLSATPSASSAGLGRGRGGKRAGPRRLTVTPTQGTQRPTRWPLPTPRGRGRRPPPSYGPAAPASAIRKWGSGSSTSSAVGARTSERPRRLHFDRFAALWPGQHYAIRHPRPPRPCLRNQAGPGHCRGARRTVHGPPDPRAGGPQPTSRSDPRWASKGLEKPLESSAATGRIPTQPRIGVLPTTAICWPGAGIRGRRAEPLTAYRALDVLPPRWRRAGRKRSSGFLARPIAVGRSLLVRAVTSSHQAWTRPG